MQAADKLRAQLPPDLAQAMQPPTWLVHEAQQRMVLFFNHVLMQEIVIDQVLAVGNGAELKVGTPLVSGATVKATVVAHGKHDKVRIFKMRRRKHYQKRQGHRQQFTELQIGAISA